jgi:hypothetical protein
VIIVGETTDQEVPVEDQTANTPALALDQAPPTDNHIDGVTVGIIVEMIAGMTVEMTVKMIGEMTAEMTAEMIVVVEIAEIVKEAEREEATNPDHPHPVEDVKLAKVKVPVPTTIRRGKIVTEENQTLRSADMEAQTDAANDLIG